MWVLSQCFFAKPANLAALHEPRRTATLTALFQTLEATALDDATELFDALATDIFTQAEKAHRKSRLRSLRDLDAAAIMLRDVGRHVVADEDDEMPVAGWKQAPVRADRPHTAGLAVACSRCDRAGRYISTR
jgi:CBS-domain-containing membrane protein